MSSHANNRIAFTPQERSASLSLSFVIGLRMLGLFLMLPVMALGAQQLQGGEDPRLIGLALGIYGLTQALLQLPFGMASDRLGRRRVIVFGLLVFAMGSFLAANADSVWVLIVGRALQGAGAVSAAVSAFLADRTREVVRTRAMAMVGASIGLAFALSLVAAPLLYGAIGLSGLLGLTGVLALMACLMVMRVPEERANANAQTSQEDAPPLRSGWALFFDAQLGRLNLGIFAMMAVQTAMFVAIPLGLQGFGLQTSSHWQVYLPMLVLAFVGMIPLIFWAERRGRFRPIFLVGIAILMAGELVFLQSHQFPGWMFAIWLFMFGFNLMEALLPSWVSRAAPARQRGLVMGLYNTAQSLGLFAGGLAGGLAAKAFGLTGIFLFCLGILSIWGIMSLGLVEIGARSAGRSADHPTGG
ncbi:MAG: MFS transporter [Burkholderiaceae bacterium]